MPQNNNIKQLHFFLTVNTVVTPRTISRTHLHSFCTVLQIRSPDSQTHSTHFPHSGLLYLLVSVASLRVSIYGSQIYFSGIMSICDQ